MKENKLFQQMGEPECRVLCPLPDESGDIRYIGPDPSWSQQPDLQTPSFGGQGRSRRPHCAERGEDVAEEAE